ncbi:MAG: MFS transporter [Acidobacteria bacterium]|jgi:PAT family beta-lactamase induction signal transducer AmpG|nr:MFS transporter [Acidobacteriota bacterium]
MKKAKWDKNYLWTFSTYFTEGFPYILIRTVSTVFFRDMKVSLESIGLVNFFSIPWILKFLWGPQVDEYSTKRKWMLTMQALFMVVLVAVALVVPLKNNVQLIAALFFIGAFIAATNDVAIDGYYMEALDKAGQAKFVGYRTMAYRVAMSTGTLVIVTVGTRWGWFAAFLTAAVIFGLFFLFNLFFLKDVEPQKKSIKVLILRGLKLKTFLLLIGTIYVIITIRYFFQSPFYNDITNRIPLLKNIYFSHWVALLLLLGLVLIGIFRKRIKAFITRDPDSFYGKSFVYFMEREKISTILFFIILLRLGEWTLATMVAPFFVDLGIKVHYGWISFAGMPASIAGAMLGGWMISRFTLKRVIWPFILAQNFTNIIYMALAIHVSSFLKINTGAAVPISIGTVNLILAAGVHAFDQFAGGLGTAVLTTYVMRICHPEFKAAHYAIGSGLWNISAIFAGVFGGLVAGWLGYAWLFGLSFFISIPAMILIRFLPYLNEKDANS